MFQVNNNTSQMIDHLMMKPSIFHYVKIARTILHQCEPVESVAREMRKTIIKIKNCIIQEKKNAGCK